MRILRCSIRHYRGFDELEIVPRGHVLLVGAPRSGRSDVLNALSKVFELEQTRLEERDFHKGDLSRDIEIEVTLGDLSVDLAQRFLEDLEVWNPADKSVVGGANDLSELPPDHVPVLRIAYRGRWDEIDQRGNQVIFAPKRSDPGVDSLRRIRREDRETLPFHRLLAGKPLNLAPRGLLRSSLSSTEASALNSALDDMRAGIDELSRDLAASVPVIESLRATIDVIRPYLNTEASIEEVVEFLADEGSLSGLLRALNPGFDLGDGVGFLPLSRHGSTLQSQVSISESIATARHDQAVVMIDDYADTLDASSAIRLASLLRRESSQVWISTRSSHAARSFEMHEVIRITREPADQSPTRAIHYGSTPSTRAQRVVAREMYRQILPAMTSRGLIIVEGTHDSSAYSALAERQDSESGVIPPEAYGVQLIDGGMQGGIDRAAHLSDLARSLGFRVVALIDYDLDETTAAARLSALQMAANAVIRLPRGYAIEAAMVDGISDEALVESLAELNSSYGLPLSPGWQNLSGAKLKAQAIKALKSNNGLHAQFIYALSPPMPSMACRALECALSCCVGANTNAFVQL